MKDSQTLINAEQIEMDAMENTLDPPSKVCFCSYCVKVVLKNTSRNGKNSKTNFIIDCALLCEIGINCKIR